MNGLVNLWNFIYTHLMMVAVSYDSLNDMKDKVLGGGVATPTKAEQGTINFYLDFSDVLHLHYGIIQLISGFLEGCIVNLLWVLDNSLSKIFSAMFGLLGWDGNLADSSSPLNGLYTVIFVIGWAMLIVGIAFVALQSMGHATKWSKIMPNVIMVALTLSVLPLMMRVAGGNSTIPGFGDITQSAISDLNNAKDKNGDVQSDIAVLPFKNNIVDLGVLMGKNWNNFKGPRTKGFETSKFNPINTGNDITSINFSTSMNKDTLKSLGLTESWFLSKWLDHHDKKDGSIEAVHYNLTDGVIPGSHVLLKNYAGNIPGYMDDENYARYSVNWIGLVGQALILAFALLVAAFRVVKDIFELTLMNLVAPLLAYQSVRSTKKLKDLVNSIIGLYLSLVLLVLLVKVFMIFIQYAPEKLSGDLNTIQQSVATLIIYAGATYGMFAGIAYFERITGVSQGFADEAGQAMAAGALIGGAATGSFALGKKGVGALGSFGGHGGGKGLSSAGKGGGSNPNLSSDGGAHGLSTGAADQSLGNEAGAAGGAGASVVGGHSTNNNTSSSNSHGISQSQSSSNGQSSSSSQTQGGQSSSNTQGGNSESHTQGGDNNTSEKQVASGQGGAGGEGGSATGSCQTDNVDQPLNGVDMNNNSGLTGNDGNGTDGSVNPDANSDIGGVDLNNQSSDGASEGGNPNVDGDNGNGGVDQSSEAANADNQNLSQQQGSEPETIGNDSGSSAFVGGSSNSDDGMAMAKNTSEAVMPDTGTSGSNFDVDSGSSYQASQPTPEGQANLSSTSSGSGVSEKLFNSSKNYLIGNRFNLSQRGHVSGVDSEHLDDD